MSISSILSNIITGIFQFQWFSVSEFVFSEVTQNFENLNAYNSIATIYFAYKLNLFSHFAQYFIKLINYSKQRLIVN